MTLQSQVKLLVADLLKRFPVIDELINNVGSVTSGKKVTTVDGVDESFAVNVISQLLMTRRLVPALKAASPTGKVQNTTGGFYTDTMDVTKLEGEHTTVGLGLYSHSKRVMECMTIALSKELAADGIVVNVVGGGLPAATQMTRVIEVQDVPFVSFSFRAFHTFCPYFFPAHCSLSFRIPSPVYSF
jgi:NAD(P)-dependent dehydrogenase (short-subunit alcohol dehydrogenase family)